MFVASNLADIIFIKGVDIVFGECFFLFIGEWSFSYDHGDLYYGDNVTCGLITVAKSCLFDTLIVQLDARELLKKTIHTQIDVRLDNFCVHYLSLVFLF